MSVDPAAEGGDKQPQSSTSRLPRSNSVNSCTPENPASEESGGYDERVAERAAECVEEFREEYPYLAGQPLSETPGRSLRSELVETEWVEEHVAGDREWERGFSVDRVDRAEAVTWAEALFRFLTARQPYDDGLGGRFESRYDGETFVVNFEDCWTSAYGDEQAAKNAAFQRQLMGGEYPENEDSARSGERVEGEWDDVATIMLTRTGSSKPDGSRVPPVDHADQVARTWSDGGVYDVVRNAAEYHLGLESDQWGYVRGDDVHGLDADEPGMNACHVHCHDAVYIDLEATGLRDEFGTDDEIEAVIESAFYPAIEKHVEVCGLAKPEAHTREKAVEVRLDLEEPAGYATEYLRLQEDTPMMEMPVEMQAFAAVEWSQNRQRIARSKIFNDAAKADLCLQDKDRAHGFRLKYDKHGDVVCADCGTSVGIDAGTIAEYRLSGSSASEPTAVADGGVENAVRVGVRVGSETVERECSHPPGSNSCPLCVTEPGAIDADIQIPEDAAPGRRAEYVAERVAVYVEACGEPVSVASVMGELGIDPKHREAVEAALCGGQYEAVGGPERTVEPIYGEPPELPPEYELVEIVNPDGTTEAAGSGGGGVSMAELVLPEERLLRETRLKFIGSAGNPKMRCEKTGFATYSAETMARYLVEKCDVREPWHAEVLLSFEEPSREREVRPVFEEPVSEPPMRE